MGGAPEQIFLAFWRGEKSVSLLEFEPRPVQPVTQSLYAL